MNRTNKLLVSGIYHIIIKMLLFNLEVLNKPGNTQTNALHDLTLHLMYGLEEVRFSIKS